MDCTPRASNWHSANDVIGPVKNGPQEYLRTLQGWNLEHATKRGCLVDPEETLYVIHAMPLSTRRRGRR